MDLYPRLSIKDTLVEAYAQDIENLPAIEINQNGILIDGLHRIKAHELVENSEISVFVTETESDDEIADLAWLRNMKHGNAYTREERKKRAEQLYKRDISKPKIAKRVGVSERTIRGWFKSADEQRKKERNELILRLHEQGWTQKEIAEEVSLSQRAVSEIIRTFGKNAKSSKIESGHWYRLGRHLLYCGDTSTPEFINRLTPAGLAFADPPYGSTGENWDNDFYWEHDYLSNIADIVTVTPGIVNIPDFVKKTEMPYMWMMDAWIKNGMTRGAIGFGNHIPVFVFSRMESIYKNAQDFRAITVSGIANGHKGQKPMKLMQWVIGLFSEEGETIIDPFAGSGQTLMACEEMGRVCITGEMNIDFCKNIIERWEKATGESVENAD